MVLPIGQVPKRPKFGSGLKPGQLPASVSGRQRQQPPQGFAQPPRFGQSMPGASVSSAYQPISTHPQLPGSTSTRPQATPAPPTVESPGSPYPVYRPSPPQQPPVTPNDIGWQPWPIQGPLNPSWLPEATPGATTPEPATGLPAQQQQPQPDYQLWQQQPTQGQSSGYQPPQRPDNDLAARMAGWPDQPQQQPGRFPSPEITSGIAPQSVFQPYQTQTAVNQAMASGQQAALTPGQNYLPGISQGSPALQSRGVVDQAGALAGGYQQAEQIRLGDRMTNIQALLQGQQTRAQDVLGQAGNRFGISATNQQYGNQMANLMLSSILSRLGGAGNLLGNQLGDRDFWARLGLTGQQGRAGDILSRFGTLGQLYDTGGY